MTTRVLRQPSLVYPSPSGGLIAISQRDPEVAVCFVECPDGTRLVLTVLFKGM